MHICVPCSLPCSLLCGPEDPLVARQSKPTSLRAIYGTDAVCNAVEGSADSVQANKDIDSTLYIYTDFVQYMYIYIYIFCAGQQQYSH